MFNISKLAGALPKLMLSMNSGNKDGFLKAVLPMLDDETVQAVTTGMREKFVELQAGLGENKRLKVVLEASADDAELYLRVWEYDIITTHNTMIREIPLSQVTAADIQNLLQNESAG